MRICESCGNGKVVDQVVKGRLIRMRDDACAVVPDNLSIPTCTSCVEFEITAAQLEELLDDWGIVQRQDDRL